MLDRKQRLFRLIENYMNDFHKEAVREIYGEGSLIKVHSMNYSYSTKSVLFEIVVIICLVFIIIYYIYFYVYYNMYRL